MFDKFFEEENSTYDPLISGLEPESFDTVFQELFAGMKYYLAQDEPVINKVSNVKASTVTPPPCNENVPQQSSPKPTPTIRPQTSDQKFQTIQTVEPKKKTRRFPMIRCGLCSETCVSDFAIENHEARHHAEVFNWFCSECNVHFDTLQQVNDHSIMIHGGNEMPMNDPQLSPMIEEFIFYKQTIARKATEFVREFLQARGKQMIMTATYMNYVKSELQAIMFGNTGLFLYSQAKTDLLATHSTTEHDDMVYCLKKKFIYGNFIRRVPLMTYRPPLTVFRTLTFTSSAPTKSNQPGSRTLRDMVSKYAVNAPTPIVRPKYRLAPPNQNRSIIKTSGIVRCGNSQFIRATSIRNSIAASTLIKPVVNIRQ